MTRAPREIAGRRWLEKGTSPLPFLLVITWADLLTTGGSVFEAAERWTSFCLKRANGPPDWRAQYGGLHGRYMQSRSSTRTRSPNLPLRDKQPFRSTQSATGDLWLYGWPAPASPLQRPRSSTPPGRPGAASVLTRAAKLARIAMTRQCSTQPQGK